MYSRVELGTRCSTTLSGFGAGFGAGDVGKAHAGTTNGALDAALDDALDGAFDDCANACDVITALPMQSVVRIANARRVCRTFLDSNPGAPARVAMTFIGDVV